MKNRFSFLCLSLVLSHALLLYSQTENALQLRAQKIDAHIELDGLLAEPEWQQAQAASGFRQNQPREGEAATENTEVRVLYDEGNIYVGVKCYDHEPQKIVAQKLQRDGGLEDDDMFAFLLDTYHDKRNAYFFATNPNAAEEDGQMIDGAFRADLDWDGVWEVRAKIHDEGWSAEFKIPLWNLKFNALAEQSWGINFTRIIKRKTEITNWASWSRDNLGGFLRVSRAGDLVGLQNVRPGRNLQVKPYGLSKVLRDDLLTSAPIKDEKLDAGLDVKYGVTSNLTLDMTANTDFAQVEADVEQVNLTRFPLFFPEKREFYLESANTFQFGEENFFGPPPIQLFYSRRIGIQNVRDQNEIVPIIAGGRLTGKVGNYELGLLDMLTDEKSGAPQSHFSVVRVNRDVAQRSKVGLIFTNRVNHGRGHQQAYGADANLWLSNPLVFQSFFAQTHDSRGATKTAWKLGLDFTKDHWGWFASHMAIDSAFAPGVGFVLRSNIRRSFATFRVSPQPNGSFLRRTNIFQNFSHLTNIDGRVQDWDYRLTFINELANGDNLVFGYGRLFERLGASFQFPSGLRINAGDYYSNLFEANYESSAKRKFVAFGSAYWQEFYGGELRSWAGGFGYTPNAHWAVRANYRRTLGELETDLFALRVNYAHNTRLFINTLVQYNSETNELSTNLRLNFIHSPGSDLFLVYNDSRGREGEDFSDGLPSRNREVILKFTKLLRF